MFHALVTTLPSSYWILYVPSQSTSWMMKGPSQGGDSLCWSLLPWTGCRYRWWSLKDQLGDQRGGEWMWADKNSSRRRLKLQQDELARSDPQNHMLHTSTFCLPKPRSHWSATGPRNQQTTLRAKTHQHAQRRRVVDVVFVLLEFPSPSRRIFICSHSLPPLWFVVSVLHLLTLSGAVRPHAPGG
jgi:hypothetical protein